MTEITYDFSRYDAIYDRAYKQGYRHGAEDEKKANVWNIPEARPNHLEAIAVIIKPYDKKSQKYCKKNKLNWIRCNGIYANGRELFLNSELPEADYNSEDWPDIIILTEKNTVPWDSVLLWESLEIPEWFIEKFNTQEAN